MIDNFQAASQMARKRKKSISGPKPFCYYCGRGFPDEKVLIQHQRARHFKCQKCYKKMSTAHALMNHMYQVHKETMKKVQNAKEGRDSIELAIYGMNGVPQEVIEQRNARDAQRGSDDESSEHSGDESDDASGDEDGGDEGKRKPNSSSNGAPPATPAPSPAPPSMPSPQPGVFPTQAPQQYPGMNPMMPGMNPMMNPMMMNSMMMNPMMMNPMMNPMMRPPMHPMYYPQGGMPPMMGRPLPPHMMGGMPQHMGENPPTSAPPSFQQPPHLLSQQQQQPPQQLPTPPTQDARPPSPNNSASYAGGRTAPVEGEEADKKGNIKVLFVFKDDLSMEEKRALLSRYQVA